MTAHTHTTIHLRRDPDRPEFDVWQDPDGRMADAIAISVGYSQVVTFHLNGFSARDFADDLNAAVDKAEAEFEAREAEENTE